jgi:hypothetical protein
VAFEAWSGLRAAAPGPDSPGFLDHFDRERAAFRELTLVAERALGAEVESLKARLGERLAEARLDPGSAVWERAWKHHWGRLVCEAWGIGE